MIRTSPSAAASASLRFERGAWPRSWLSALLFGPLLTGCLYIKDPALSPQWTKANAAYAGADYLKVYDNQLTQLSTYAGQENLSTARALVAERDETITVVLSGVRSAPSADCAATAAAAPATWAGADLLGQVVACDLQRFAGPRATIDNLANLNTNIHRAEEEEGRAQFVLDQALLDFAADKAAPVRPPDNASDRGNAKGAATTPAVDTSCEALKDRSPEQAAADGTTRIKAACARLARDDDEEASILASMTNGYRPSPGSPPLSAAQLCKDAPANEIIGVYCAGYAAKAATSTAGSVDAAATFEASLQAQITAAKAANTANQDALAAFGKSLQSDVSQIPSGAAQVAALSQLSSVIDAISRADICNEQAQFDKATVTAAKCDAASATPLEQKADATWSFLNALALLADAANSHSRSVQWLAGAQAIVQAQKANAQLLADQEKASATAAKQRYQALVIQVSSEAQALETLKGANSTVWTDGPACAGDRGACALTLYVDAVNRGAIPAAVLALRDDQLAREYAVRRERAAADRDSQLLKAASAQMQAYVDGGVDPTLIVRLLFDAGLIGATAAS